MNIQQAKIIMGLAAEYADSKSTCIRRQIGCILLNENGQVVSVGHNHSSERGENCRTNPCKGADLPRGEHTTAQGVCEADLHAEIVALLGLPIGMKASTAIVTCPPCSSCADALLKGGVKLVIVPKEVLDRDGSKEFLEKNGVEWLAI